MPNNNKKTPRNSSSFFNFTKWVKDTILRKSKAGATTTTTTTTITTNPNENRVLVRRASSRKSLPSGRRRRRSRKSNRRRSVGTYLSEKKIENPTTINDTINKNDGNQNNNNNVSKNNNDNNKNNNTNNNNNNKNNKNKNNNNINNKNSFVKKEIPNNNNDDNNKNETIIITPKIKSGPLVELKSNVCEIPCGDSNSSSSPKDSSSSENVPNDSKNSRDEFFENTLIIKGSDEHFIYVRTLRKLRRDKQRPTNQVILLNEILIKVSDPSKLSDELRKELYHYKTRVYELNRLKRNSIFTSNDTYGRVGPYSSFNNNNNNNPTLSLCPTSLMNKRLSEIMAENRPISPITMKYRPTYASSKVVTIFDEESNQLIVKELPVARRKRRLSDLSNILARSTSSSSTSSTNSSQSSLVTLTDDVEQLKYSTLCKEPETFISNTIIIRKDDHDGDEDDVPLFVLKEQFKYSGRGHSLVKNNNFPSLEGNRTPCVTSAA